jgi:hypothetical protein
MSKSCLQERGEGERRIGDTDKTGNKEAVIMIIKFRRTG